MGYAEAKRKYSKIGIDTEKAIAATIPAGRATPPS